MNHKQKLRKAHNLDSDAYTAYAAWESTTRDGCSDNATIYATWVAAIQANAAALTALIACKPI
jgi:hypothetical protein